MSAHPLPIAMWLLIFGIWPALAQDAENGQEVFKKCRTCHQVGDTAKNSVGPVLKAEGRLNRGVQLLPGEQGSRI
jgi:cytochrome c2